MPLRRHNQHTGCFPRDSDLGTVMASLTSDLSAPVQVKGDYLRAGVQGSTTPERYLLTRTTASSCRT
ncbi:unnamed protein product [Urochloa humidicola]